MCAHRDCYTSDSRLTDFSHHPNARYPSRVPPSVAALIRRNEILIVAGPQEIVIYWTLEGLQILELLALIIAPLFTFQRLSCEAPAFVSCGPDILPRAGVVESKVDGCANLACCRRRLGGLIGF